MKKYLFAPILGLTAFILVGGTVAAAHGFNFGGPGIDDQAQLLGMTTDELRSELATKSMAQILDEQGITHQQLAEARQASHLDEQASLLGISVDELTSELETKTFAQLLDEKGISHEQLQELRQQQHLERATEHLQTMVDSGQITQEEMQTRLDEISSHEGNGFGDGMHEGMHMGMHPRF